MNVVQAGRLLTLAHFLRTEVPRKRFDMGEYVGGGCEEGRDGVRPFSKLEEEGICGSPACALGWASVVWPRKFRVMSNNFQVMRFARWTSAFYSEDEVQEFFGLDRRGCINLFVGDCDVTPKSKARQIERLVAKHGYVVEDAA